MTVQVRRSTVIAATPEEVWPWLANAELELAWRTPQVTAVEQLDDGPLRPGVRFRGAAELLGSTDTWVSEVTEVDPPRLLAWRALEATAPAYAHGRYELEPVGAGTRATIEIDYEPRTLVGRLILPVFGRIVPPRVISGFLDNLKERVEQQPDRTARSARDGGELAGDDDADTGIGDRSHR